MISNHGKGTLWPYPTTNNALLNIGLTHNKTGSPNNKTDGIPTISMVLFNIGQTLKPNPTTKMVLFNIGQTHNKDGTPTSNAYLKIGISIQSKNINSLPKMVTITIGMISNHWKGTLKPNPTIKMVLFNIGQTHNKAGTPNNNNDGIPPPPTPPPILSPPPNTSALTHTIRRTHLGPNPTATPPTGQELSTSLMAWKYSKPPNATKDYISSSSDRENTFTG
jgi:hypothetical protein